MALPRMRPPNRTAADAPGIARECFPMIDGRRAADIRFSAAAVPLSACLLQGAEPIERLYDLATAMIGAEAIGVMRCMIDDTIAYTKERSQFGQRMKGTGAWADMLAQRFGLACRKLGLNRDRVVLDCSQYHPGHLSGQQSLF